MSKIKFGKKYRKESNASNIQEEQRKNKFDCNYNLSANSNNKNSYTKKYTGWASRKYSKDSSNLSTSNEDIQENKEHYNFSFNSNNFKTKSRSINSYNNTFRNDLKQINSGKSKQIVFENILSSDSKSKNQNMKSINSLHKNEIITPFSEGQKKTRAVSTAPHQIKINFVKEKDNINEKEKENNNINNNNIINNINNNINNGNISSSIYNSKAALNANQIKNRNDKLSKYEIGQTIGKGAYAKVKIVTNLLNQEKYAMKIYDKDKLNDNSKRKCVYREIEILKRINHKNIK